eukprot:TRINITY_DN8347_c0_g1_i1.p1 TRINITY_DN8347_c0_g1~~TRINITY_DN8347_c0_g1_i1.p1  ORF type:complete len:256 (+),score=28.66 TRINITY_DN8347_c0_g1_i1:1-768(+)
MVSGLCDVVSLALAQLGLDDAHIMYVHVSTDVLYGLESQGPLSYYAVVALPLHKFFGVSPPPDNWTHTLQLQDRGSVIVRVDELKKLCRQVRASSTSAFEALFTTQNNNHITYQSPAWLRLVAMRDMFVTQYMAVHYLGQARSHLDITQKMKPKSSKFETWPLYNIYRALFAADMIIKGSLLVITFEEGSPELACLREMKGVSNAEELAAGADKARALLDSLQSALASCPYKASVTQDDERTLGTWLTSTRLSLL